MRAWIAYWTNPIVSNQRCGSPLSASSYLTLLRSCPSTNYFLPCSILSRFVTYVYSTLGFSTLKSALQGFPWQVCIQNESENEYDLFHFWGSGGEVTANPPPQDSTHSCPGIISCYGYVWPDSWFGWDFLNANGWAHFHGLVGMSIVFLSIRTVMVSFRQE